ERGPRSAGHRVRSRRPPLGWPLRTRAACSRDAPRMLLGDRPPLARLHRWMWGSGSPPESPPKSGQALCRSKRRQYNPPLARTVLALVGGKVLAALLLPYGPERKRGSAPGQTTGRSTVRGGSLWTGYTAHVARMRTLSCSSP